MGETKALIIGAALATIAVVICTSLTILVEIQACTKRTGAQCYLHISVKQATP